MDSHDDTGITWGMGPHRLDGDPAVTYPLDEREIPPEPAVDALSDALDAGATVSPSMAEPDDSGHSTNQIPWSDAEFLPWLEPYLDERMVPPSNARYSTRFIAALGVAARLHASQARKGTTIPYVAHLLGACAIALEFGADEDEAIAALLHDMIEDVEPTEAARAAVAAFGPRVTAIVDACTDSDAHPKPPWRARKEAYLASIGRDDRSALLVSASDKLHNARAIVADLRRYGDALWARFNPEAGRTGHLWYYRELVRCYRANPEHAGELVEELARVVAEMEQLATGR